MQKRLLVAVDESIHAQNALLYAAGFYFPDSDFELTLMNVQPIISMYLKEEAKNRPIIEMALKEMETENRANSQKILDNCRDLLIREGIKAECIETVSQVRTLGLTKDIIEYGRIHGFDAIVVGRRGLTRIQKVFMGSTSAKLMEHANDISLWIVDGQVRPQNLLVAVDLQAPMSPLIDHILKMCPGLDRLHLTFFHVYHHLKLRDFAPHTPGADEIDALLEQHEKQTKEYFWDQIRNDLINSGLSEDQITIKFVRLNAITGSKTAKMIIEEVAGNPYDTVIMGRSGSGKAYFFGHVSRYVSERLTDHAIWLIG